MTYDVIFDEENDKNFKNKHSVEEPRINQELRFYPEVRLVYKEKTNEKSENDFTKVVTISEAFKLSREYELDLVEINGKVTPPIVRLCDYTKYLFDKGKLIKTKSKFTFIKEGDKYDKIFFFTQISDTNSVILRRQGFKIQSMEEGGWLGVTDFLYNQKEGIDLGKLPKEMLNL